MFHVNLLCAIYCLSAKIWYGGWGDIFYQWWMIIQVLSSMVLVFIRICCKFFWTVGTTSNNCVFNRYCLVLCYNYAVMKWNYTKDILIFDVQNMTHCATCKYLVKLQRGLKPATISIEKLKYYIDDHAFSRCGQITVLWKKGLELPPFSSWEDNSNRLMN